MSVISKTYIDMFTRVRNKVQCYCKVCNGKFVDERTRNRHAELEDSLASSISGFIPSLLPSHDSSSNLNVGYNTVSKESPRMIRTAEQEALLPEDDDYYELAPADIDQYLPLKKRRRQDRFQEVEAVLEGHDVGSIEPIDEDEVHDDDSNDDDDDKNEGDDNEEEDDDNDGNDKEEGDDDNDGNDEEEGDDDDGNDGNDEEGDDDNNNNYNYEQFDIPNTTFDCANSWIVLWILKYQSRFRLSDVAINVLIKFFRQVLQDVSYARFKEFPSSLFIVKKLLKVGKCSNYAVCPCCNTLYDVTEVTMEDGFKCKHIEFPNHPMRTKRQSCGTELTVQVPIGKSYKR
jgi:hypothetical protein